MSSERRPGTGILRGFAKHVVPFEFGEQRQFVGRVSLRDGQGYTAKWHIIAYANWDKSGWIQKKDPAVAGSSIHTGD